MPGSESHDEGHKAKLFGQQGGLLEAAQRFWQKSYAGDYLGLAVLFAAYSVIQLSTEPFHQMFTLSDTRIQHPHAEVERVPVFMLFIYAAAIPAILLLIWNLIIRPDLHKAHVTLLGLAIAIITTSFLTDVFKNAIGRPRPDLIARCKPEAGAPRDQLVTIEVCTETDHHLLHDGWRSFPSGHSSFSFAGLGWLALFMASQSHCLRPRASLIVFLLCATPLVGAALIAISRLEDYRHDVFDVTCGSILGLLITYLTWRRYYPGLMSSHCDEPFEPLSSGKANANGGFQRVRDEEEGYGAAGRYSIGNEPEDYNRRSER